MEDKPPPRKSQHQLHAYGSTTSSVDTASSRQVKLVKALDPNQGGKNLEQLKKDGMSDAQIVDFAYKAWRLAPERYDIPDDFHEFLVNAQFGIIATIHSIFFIFIETFF